MNQVLHILPAIIGTLLSLAISAFLTYRRPGRSWLWAALFGILVSIWCLMQVASLRADTLPARILSAQIQYLAITTVPLVWLVMCLKEAGSRRLGTLFVPLLLVIPAITMFFALTYQPGHSNPLWNDFSFSSGPVYGRWFWAHAAYCYSLVLVGCLILFLHFAQSPHYRQHLVITTVLPLLVMTLNLLYVSGNWPWRLDPTPLGFVIGFSVWVAYRSKLLQVSPISRHVAIDSLADGIFVVDKQGNVLDFNHAAKAFIGERKAVLGTPLRELLPLLPDLGTLDGTRVVSSGPGQYMEVKTTPVNRASPQYSHLIVTLRDITEEKRINDLLIAAREELEAANDELDRLAHTDELTGLANRRFLLMRLDEEIARARRLGQPLGVLFIDLDHFKKLNDTFGHGFGDDVLRAQGQLLLNHRKGIDIAARYGGEELILVIANTSREGVIGAAQRLWQQIREASYSPDSRRKLNITASIGIALLEQNDLSGYDLIDRADKALYEAKSRGRDRVCLAEEGKFTIVKKPAQQDATLGAPGTWT